MTTVLLVEDEPHIVEFVTENLFLDGFEVLVATSAEHAKQVLKTTRPQIIVLDIRLPGMDGFEFCRHIRQGEMDDLCPAISRIPIIMLTALAEDEKKLEGFGVGADDYLVKPFNPLELTARINALLRRAEEDATAIIQISGLVLNSIERTALLESEPLDLAPKEFDLLFVLAGHPNRVFSREELLEKVWGYRFLGRSRTVDEHIKRLRKKLSVTPGYADLILTERGVGYKLQASELPLQKADYS
jgi:DNA-binding response OmpR family regulator